MKGYKEVKAVTMSDSNNVYSINYVDDNKLYATKKEAIEMSEYALINGSKYSGRSLCSLPQKIQNQISKMLKKVEVKK